MSYSIAESIDAPLIKSRNWIEMIGRKRFLDEILRFRKGYFLEITTVALRSSSRGLSMVHFLTFY